jgi:ribosomal protein S12 methylthiotransferase accessory factor
MVLPDALHARRAPGVDGALALACAQAAAAACGVTRLANITGLDRVGVPVFQAIRPRSRALAVHQGKGLTATEAQLGALMEAAESAHAEAFETRSTIAAWRDLPSTERPAYLSDFARIRGVNVGADEPIAWTMGQRIVDGSPLQAPFECVSLDCVRPWDRRLDHTSNGLAARFDLEGAVLKGLLEVLERDGVAVWRRQPLTSRATYAIDAGSIRYPWFVELVERLERMGIYVWLYSIPTIAQLPAVFAEVFDSSAPPGSRAQIGGCACGARAEDALRGAVLEALQARLTLIAGARDDILYDDYGDARGGAGWPPPPHLKGLDWESLPGAEDDAGEVTSLSVAERLASAGYPDVAVVRLSAPDASVCVVKVFAPGLAANRRVRRRPRARRAP